jgi:ferrous iron transport protein B
MGASKEAKKTLDQKFREENSEFFKIVKKGRYEVEGKKTKDKTAKKVYRAYKKMDKKLAGLRRERKKESIRVSYLGRFGRFLEPVSMWAGFNWRVNIALASSFAAKENMVATLGTIYSMEAEQAGVKREALAETMKKTEADWTPLHALVIMLFIALFPPCIATLIMVRVETNSTGWMLFAAIYPIILGFLLAVGAFQGGQFLGFGALGTMISLLVLSLVIMTAVGFMGRKPEEV